MNGNVIKITMESVKINFEKYKLFFKTENFESNLSKFLNTKEVFPLLEEYHPKYFSSDTVARALDLDQILNGECNARLLDIEKSFVDDIKKEYPHLKGSLLNAKTLFRIKKELTKLLTILLKEIFHTEEKNFEAGCNSSKDNPENLITPQSKKHIYHYDAYYNVQDENGNVVFSTVLKKDLQEILNRRTIKSTVVEKVCELWNKTNQLDIIDEYLLDSEDCCQDEREIIIESIFEFNYNLPKPNLKEKTLDSVERTLKENQKILNFIKEYQEKNDYNPRFLDEYNAKFNNEFNYFLKNSNFSKETIELFKLEN